MGPLPNGRTLWLIHGGDPNHLQVLGAHPPSTPPEVPEAIPASNTHLKNISQNGNLPQIGVKIKNI